MPDGFGAFPPRNGNRTCAREFAHWAKHNFFRKHCKDVLSGLDYAGYSCKAHLESLKLVFRDVAEKKRNHVFSAEPKSQESLLVQLSTIARGVWSGNQRIANLAISTTLLGPLHLSSGPGRPKLLNPVAFALEFANAERFFMWRKIVSTCTFFPILPEA